MSSLSRRSFVARSLAAGAAAGSGPLAFLDSLPAVSAADARPNPAVVQFSPEIEPLVRLIEDTPREHLIAAAAERVRQKMSYQELLAAVLLAGVRNLKPRPVGFEFHAVLVIHSAHLAALSADDQDRWLPLFWALDNFKASQAVKKRKGAWAMPALDEARLPPAHEARQRFTEAMDRWDEEGADRAVTALYRSAGAAEIMELFWRYGARDFRDIGHKAIYVANSFRALQTIGWRHAEPVLRSLAFALLEHEGDNPAKRDAEPDRPWRENQARANAIGELNHSVRKAAPEAAADVLAAVRSSGPAEACSKVVELLRKNVAPQSVWDGLFLAAGELLMRQPGIVGVHCITSVNALHQAYQLTGSDLTRRLTLLQAAGFLGLFRKFMLDSGGLADIRIDALPREARVDDVPQAVGQVFQELRKDRLAAARKVLVLADGRPDAARLLMKEGRRLIFTKGTNAHDYKFSSAALEDFYHVSTHWRAHYLAASVFNLRGAGDADNDLIRRTRDALANEPPF
jgi:hypothetical protein